MLVVISSIICSCRRFNIRNYIRKTDIYLSKEDIISTLEITENSDEHYTALSVFGDEDLTIAAVNPLGTTTIYNFDCYGIVKQIKRGTVCTVIEDRSGWCKIDSPIGWISKDHIKKV